MADPFMSLEKKVAMESPTPRPREVSSEAARSDRLESWKEIANYLKRGVRTVQRWEKLEDLPVHRHLHEKLGTVYAYKSELETWWNNRRPLLEHEEKERARWARLRWVAAAVVAFAVVAALAAWRYWSSSPRPGQSAGTGEITVRRVWAAGNRMSVAAISPDGRFLVYVGPQPGDLFLRELATAQTRSLVKRGGFSEYPTFSAISPDGRTVAYGWHNRDFFFDLRSVTLDAGQPRVIYRNREVYQAQPHDWSPDGREILALFSMADGTARIAAVAAEGGTARVLKALNKQRPMRLRFSPDGRYIAYDRPTGEGFKPRDIFVLESNGRAEAPLVTHPADDFLLGWAPAGDAVLFASERTGTLGAWMVPVHEGRAAAPPRLVKSDIGHVSPLHFTHDGAYYYLLGTRMDDVYTALVDWDAGRIAAPSRVSQRLEGSQHSPAWSPDGKLLAHMFARSPQDSRDSGLVLSIRNTATGEGREFNLRLSRAVQLSWSPDGQSLVANAGDLDGRQGLFQIEAGTGKTTLIVLGGPDITIHQPAWSADGTHVFYTRVDWSQKLYRFFALDLKTGRDREVFRSVAPAAAGGLALAPDGRRLAFFLRNPEAGGNRIMLLAAEGGQPRELFWVPQSESVGELAWSHDGRHVVLLKGAGRPATETKSELWRFPVEGGPPVKVALPMEGVRDLRLHPDGRHLAFTAGNSGTDLWVMENFLPRR